MSKQRNFTGGIFYDRESAERAVDRLGKLGYSPDDVSVMTKDQEQAKRFADDTGTKATEGALTGGILGGTLGAIVAALTATGSIAAVVGTGGAAAPLVIGPLAAALAGIGAGTVAGGIVGALIGAGIPETDAREYEAGLDRGGMLLVVKPRDETREDLERLFKPNYGSSDVKWSEVGSVDYGNDRTARDLERESQMQRRSAL